MQESQIDTSTTERQLLYDIRTESRKTNDLLSVLVSNVIEKQDVSNDLFPQLLEVLNQIANGLAQKEVKVAKSSNKPKRGNTIAKIK